MFCRQHNMVWWMVYQIGELVLHGKQQLLLSSVLYLVNQGFKPNVAKFSNFSKETRNLNFLHEYEVHPFSPVFNLIWCDGGLLQGLWPPLPHSLVSLPPPILTWNELSWYSLWMCFLSLLWTSRGCSVSSGARDIVYLGWCYSVHTWLTGRA